MARHILGPSIEVAHVADGDYVVVAVHDPRCQLPSWIKRGWGMSACAVCEFLREHGDGSVKEEVESEVLIDAYHEGWDAFRSAASQPYDPGALADAWKDGRRDAQRASRCVVVLPTRPEGYYHSRPEVL